METKICKQCGVEKSLEQFRKIYNKKRNYLYITNFCKECYSTKQKEWYKNYAMKNQEKIKERRKKNQEWHKKYCKNWHKKNKEREKEYRANYRERERYLRKKRWEDNLEKSRKYMREYKKENRKNELIYMKDRVRNMVNHSFRRKGYSKKSKTYEILGADYNIVWEHLKKTWFINYGTEYNGEMYQIDHKKPLASAITEEEVIKLCHYTNLQMLTPEDNWKKGDNIN